MRKIFDMWKTKLKEKVSRFLLDELESPFDSIWQGSEANSFDGELSRHLLDELESLFDGIWQGGDEGK